MVQVNRRRRSNNSSSSNTAARRTWRIPSFCRSTAHRRTTRRSLPVWGPGRALPLRGSNAAAVWTRIGRLGRRCCRSTHQDLASHWTGTSRQSEVREATAITAVSKVSIRT
uniref:(northern house mosquito) hypothetical protein n=1 Tax=Culex pipiens TaxID=7175 RepID=A0A8D8G4S7_CULPI